MGHILVVDDEAPIRILIQAAISGPDFDVLTAESGEVGLLLARENSPLDLVVTDVVMPGIDGFELASRLTAEGHAKRFLFISGYFGGQEAGPKMENFGCCAFLQKPFSIRDLIHLVKGLTAEKARLNNGITREPF